MQSQPTKKTTSRNGLLFIILGIAGLIVVCVLGFVAIRFGLTAIRTAAAAPLVQVSATSTPTNTPSSPAETSVPTPMHPTVVPPTPAPSVPYAITKDYVHVRSGPGLDYPVYGLIPPETQSEITGKSPDGLWWAVKIPTTLTASGMGWVDAAYVDVVNVQDVPVLPVPALPETVVIPAPASSGTNITTVEPVNVRSGPSTAYPSYGVVPIGINVQVIGVSSDYAWWAVSVPTSLSPDGMGWISAAYATAQNVSNVPVLPLPALPPSVVVETPSEGVARLQTLEAVNVRSGPGNGFSIYGVLGAGKKAKIIGVSPNGKWYEIVVSASISPSGVGWVNYGSVNVLNMDGVPVIK
jgi:uncharacterized protein YraI